MLTVHSFKQLLSSTPRKEARRNWNPKALHTVQIDWDAMKVMELRRLASKHPDIFPDRNQKIKEGKDSLKAYMQAQVATLGVVGQLIT